MSAGATPIPLERFAEAIAELPLGNLHAKAAELRNAIAHLESSNEQLQEYADEGDRDCADAIKENEGVVASMEARIALLKNEVESRGFRWGEDQPATANGDSGDQMDHDHVDANEPPASQPHRPAQVARTQGGSLGDEELARRLREQMSEDMEDGDDGVHL